MQKRIFLLVILTLTLLLSLFAAPAIAEDERFSHTIQYNISGRISIDRELGHACTTGAVKKQQVRGFGEMTKTENVRIASNIITVDEKTDWSTASDALRNLAVTTTIELCNRPMSTAAQTYSEGDYDIKIGDIIHTYHPLVVSGDFVVSPATDQIWATYISPNPGEEGSYHSNFIAAYGPGPYEAAYGYLDRDRAIAFYDEEYLWEFDLGVILQQRDDGKKGYDRGDFYVGNYFEIDQYAYTSGGEFARMISMSSPFTGALLEEELFVLGMAEVRESFEMHNLKAGKDAITLRWYELF